MRQLTHHDEEHVRQRLRMVLAATVAPAPAPVPAVQVAPVDPADGTVPLPGAASGSDAVLPPRSVAPPSGRAHVGPDAGLAGTRSAMAPSGPTAADGPAVSGLGAFDPGRRGAKVLLTVAAVVVLLAGVLAWRARPRTEPVPVQAPVVEQVPLAGSPSASADIVVAVAGKVRKPGLVRLAAGARVADALRAAGGTPSGVDVTMLNLARKVVDGELILVGVTASPGAAVPGVGGGPIGGQPGALLNLNTATVGELDGLPGVGPVLAQRIVDHRQRTGGFRAVGDLRRVDGIGSTRFEQLKDLVTV